MGDVRKVGQLKKRFPGTIYTDDRNMIYQAEDNKYYYQEIGR